MKLKNRRSLLISLAILGSLLGSIKSPAIAQNAQPSLSLIDVARFYDGLPHQIRALQLLQAQIDKNNPELLAADSIVSNVWRDSDSFVGHTNTLSQIPLAQRTGTDPLTMALAIANPSAGRPLDIEVLPSGQSVEAPSQVMITIDQGGLLDDSVAGVRDRFDIAFQNGQWDITKAGRQFRCQQGRGHQDWSAELCS